MNNRMMEKDNLLTARIEDVIRLTQKTAYPHFIGFLNGHELALAMHILSQKRDICYSAFGGYAESERKMIALWADSETAVTEEDYPITGICFCYPKKYTLTHRDFLGAMTASGIKRETIGDILVTEGTAVAFVRNEIKDYLLTQTEKIGRTGVEVSEWNSKDELPFRQDFENRTYTVASARLDSIVSATVPTSREKSATWIRQGMVFVNGAEVSHISHTVKDGDIISVRGKGKFIVDEFSGVTKKGRLKINIRKYR